MHKLQAALLGVALSLSSIAPAIAADAAQDPVAMATRLLDHMEAGEYEAADRRFQPGDEGRARRRQARGGAGANRCRHRRGTKPRCRADQPAIRHDRRASSASIARTPTSTPPSPSTATARSPDCATRRRRRTPPPAPPADANYSERDFNVGSGDRALPGTLAMPKGDAPAKGFAAIVLVHGSGPQDRDETIGPNRPFLDIARGLAAQGIAVLRYEKRTKARPQDYADGNVTIDNETTDDAVAAVAALRATKGIDPARVFVLGHSQGGMMAPRIAAKSGHVAGLVLLAAPARPLLDILVEQNIRLAVLDDGKTSDAEAAAIATLKQQVARGARRRRRRRQGHADAAAGQLLAHHRCGRSVAEAKAVALPMLVLQGAQDIQVVDADWQRWKGGFNDDPKVTLQAVPDAEPPRHGGRRRTGPAAVLHSRPRRCATDRRCRRLDRHALIMATRAASSPDPRLQLEPASGRSRLWLLLLTVVLPVSLSLLLPLLAGGDNAASHFIDDSLVASRWLDQWIGPLLVAAITVVAWCVLDRLMRRHRLQLDGAGLAIATTFYRQQLALSELQLETASVVDLDEHPELKPMIKSNGMALPGFRSGWFRLRAFKKLFVASSGASACCGCRPARASTCCCSRGNPRPSSIACARWRRRRDANKLPACEVRRRPWSTPPTSNSGPAACCARAATATPAPSPVPTAYCAASATASTSPPNCPKACCR